MCGIFGYIGESDPLEICLSGLKQLEYRGYDSAGIAGVFEGKIASCKEAGKIANLEKKIRHEKLKVDFAIGHTRWATHGKPTDKNAHPHFDPQATLALVHNGIIENYDSLREELRADGAQFASDTDTEVVAHLVSKFYAGDLVAAVQKTLPLLRGTFAIALIHRDHPGEIVATARECPLCIGYDDASSEAIVSSDPNAFIDSTQNVLFLQRGEIAQVKARQIALYDLELKKIEKKAEKLTREFKAISKEGFEHFMLKEIFEQPATVQKALLGRMNEEKGCVELEESPFLQELGAVDNIRLLACGTSAHAGWLATLLLEDLVQIPASIEIASEARYRNLLFTPNTLVIAISQSGETADTLAALREAKRRGCKVLGVCNVKNSTLVREADCTLFLKAGPEVSVCSTKAFTAQIAVLTLFALHLADLHGKAALKPYFAEMRKIPGQIQQVLEKASLLQSIAKKYAAYDNFYFIGRRYMVPTCLEAALKLKEISYVNANGCPAGELKHGSIALLDARFPVVALCANHQTAEKLSSNIMEVKARGAPVIALAPEGMKEVAAIADDVFWLPPTIDCLAPFASTVAGQLLAYYIAKERGCEIDQPRNLAKSVTVE